MFKKQNEVLKPYAYYRTGGVARWLYQPCTVDELSVALREVSTQKLPFFYLGGGTNSLVSDEVWPGAVISFAQMKKLEVNGERVTVGAGVENSAFARAMLDAGLGGAAWMYRLPGQLGGTVRMNARCYGGEISEIVIKVVTVTRNGEIKTYTDKTVFRGYKDTIFMQNEEAIGEVEIELSKGDKKAIEEKMLYCEKDRESKGQFVYPTCGCVFKNNYEVGVPSGMLLDASGVKTLRKSGVSINPHHANFVYNEAASSREILEMTIAMREKVYETFGVWMDYEMELLGAFPEDLRAKLEEVRARTWHTEKLDELRLKFRSPTR